MIRSQAANAANPSTERVTTVRMLRSRAHGQVGIIFAMLLFALVGVVALSIDGGYVLAERRQTQSAADAAALAAAKTLLDEGSIEALNAAAQSYAHANAGSGSSAVVNYPPASGQYAGNTQYVQVTVTKPVRKFFVGAIYQGNWTVSATATAGIEPDSADYALIALDRGADPDIYLNGNTGIIIKGGKASAMANTNIRGSNNNTFQTPGTIDANGTIQSGSSWTTTRTNQPQIDDPLAWMTPPANKGPLQTFCDDPCTTPPGWYKNQTISVAKTLTLEPGVYYFDNTTIGMKNDGVLTGDGVTIYLDANSTIDPKNGSIDLSGPNGKPWAGAISHLVFWYSVCDNLDVQGNGDVTFRGVFYAPCSDVTMHGNPSNDTIDGQIVVGTLSVKGTSDLKLTYRKYVDTAQRHVFLVE